MKDVRFIHPAELKLYPGQTPGRWRRNPYPARLIEGEEKRIFPGIGRVGEPKLVGPPHLKGDTDEGQLKFMLRLIKWLGPKTIVELGTFRGRTALNFAHYSQKDARVLTVDLPIEDIAKAQTRRPDAMYHGADAGFMQSEEGIGSAFKGRKERGKITQQFADCTCPGTLLDTLENWLRGETVDFAYIDAAHTKEGVTAQFRSLLPLMSKGGVIVLDDYMRDAFMGVSHAALDLSERGFVFYFLGFPANKGASEAALLLFLNVGGSRGREWLGEKLF